MARERSQAQWDALSPTYRDRLQRKGISASDYKAGAKLSEARGQSKESEHARQRRLITKYGPRDRHGDEQITPDLLRKARSRYGDEWVTNKLEQMKIDHDKSARGLFPYQGDKRLGSRSGENQYYGVMADERYNNFAPFWWYHGLFG